MAQKYTLTHWIELNSLYLLIRKALNKGLQVVVEVKSSKDKKTLEQLGYWFGVICPTIQAWYRENGDIKSIDEVHKILKLDHYYEEIYSKATDTFHREGKSLVGISKERMSQLIDEVITAYSLMGVEIEPPPEKLRWAQV
ncbi:DNA repair photolyase [Elusimicrobium simillimum]|uniref:hypothetical protein n=1 Tax=Elusimicrobium simillimum TaxID=3143438 RepID=UPI003C6F29A4